MRADGSVAAVERVGSECKLVLVRRLELLLLVADSSWGSPGDESIRAECCMMVSARLHSSALALQVMSGSLGRHSEAWHCAASSSSTPAEPAHQCERDSSQSSDSSRSDSGTRVAAENPLARGLPSHRRCDSRSELRDSASPPLLLLLSTAAAAAAAHTLKASKQASKQTGD